MCCCTAKRHEVLNAKKRGLHEVCLKHDGTNGLGHRRSRVSEMEYLNTVHEEKPSNDLRLSGCVSSPFEPLGSPCTIHAGARMRRCA